MSSKHVDEIICDAGEALTISKYNKCVEDEGEMRRNRIVIRTQILEKLFQIKDDSKILGRIAPEIKKNSEKQLDRRTLSQLRSKKSSLLREYPNEIDQAEEPSSIRPSCLTGRHIKHHLSR